MAHFAADVRHLSAVSVVRLAAMVCFVLMAHFVVNVRHLSVVSVVHLVVKDSFAKEGLSVAVNGPKGAKRTRHGIGRRSSPTVIILSVALGG